MRASSPDLAMLCIPLHRVRLIVVEHGGFVLCFFVYFIVSDVAKDKRVGDKAGFAVWFLCIAAGTGIGVGLPLKAEVDREKAKQEAIVSRRAYLESLLSSSKNNFHNIPKIVIAAEEYLDLAEREFADRAFAPFWDQIENATNRLAAYYYQQVQLLERNAVEYRQGILALRGNMPLFSDPTRQLPDARPTAARLAAVVRKAQTDFQFATIYEQRKTNHILVQGFGTLAAAIYSLGNMISSSLSDLSRTLDVSLDRILESAAADAAIVREMETTILTKQDTQIRMLDNIQRGKKPSL